MPTYTLIAAHASSHVDAVELSEVAAGDEQTITLDDLHRLIDLPKVAKFFADNNYNPDHPDQLMYIEAGEVTSQRHETLTVTLPDATTLINLTPHPVTIGALTLIPTGPAPRLTATTQVVDRVHSGGHDIDITETVFGELTGLPDPQPGVYLIVSRLVAEARRDRDDLLIPGEAIRDDSGRVVGCKTLARLPR